MIERLGVGFLGLWLLGFAVPAEAIEIVSPPAEQPVFGTVTFAAEIAATIDDERVTTVRFLVDGEDIANLTLPPWQVEVDVGDDNREHTFELVIETAGGNTHRVSRITPAIRIDLAVDADLQQLYVTVNRDGAPVRDLAREHFTVRDAGIVQELVTFEGGDVPLTAELLVDASESMRGAELEAALGGARAFANRMQPLDEARLVLFSDRRLAVSTFTNDPILLTAGLDGAAAKGGTALNDQLYLALRELEERQGRRVLILLSDGEDVASVLDADEILEVVRDSSVMMYWVRLGTQRRITSAWRNVAAHDTEREQLRRAVETSGGRVVPIADTSQTSDAFAVILDELRSQYALGYYPSLDLDDGRWHELDVDVAADAVDVRHRRGYVDRP
ncbi:MAG: VWA domain-containing protein [Acidobacteriota bacterium]